MNDDSFLTKSDIVCSPKIVKKINLTEIVIFLGHGN